MYCKILSISSSSISINSINCSDGPASNEDLASSGISIVFTVLDSTEVPFTNGIVEVFDKLLLFSLYNIQ